MQTSAVSDIISRKSLKKSDLSKETLNIGEKSYDYFTVPGSDVAKVI